MKEQGKETQKTTTYAVIIYNPLGIDVRRAEEDQLTEGDGGVKTVILPERDVKAGNSVAGVYEVIEGELPEKRLRIPYKKNRLAALFYDALDRYTASRQKSSP